PVFLIDYSQEPTVSIKPYPLAYGRISAFPDLSMWRTPSILVDKIFLVTSVPAECFYPPLVHNQPLTLEACTVHLGSDFRSGHYISYIKKGSQWYCISDDYVSRVSEDFYKNITTLGLCCFYRKANATPARVKPHQPGQPAGIPKMDDVPHSTLVNARLQVVAACYGNKVKDPSLKSVIDTINQGQKNVSKEAIHACMSSLSPSDSNKFEGKLYDFLYDNNLVEYTNECGGTLCGNINQLQGPENGLEIRKLPDPFYVCNLQPSRDKGTNPLSININALHFEDNTARRADLVACIIYTAGGDHFSYIKKGDRWYVVANDMVTAFDTLTDSMLQNIYTAASVSYVYKKA
ncbi:MAG: ubiquitin carboxyl-terminal hydrolase, partial [Amoebophilaceae bacterium]|nr:ubiquitin carboxyl-terminal hydrolase [Amoebophilaceae bacterium]